jgi:hypothetical protein
MSININIKQGPVTLRTDAASQDHLVRGRQSLWRGALKPKTGQGHPDRLVCVCVSAWNSIACKGGVRDPHLGQEARNCQEMPVVDMEAAWVPIMVRCTPPGETPAQVSAEQALTSAIRVWTRWTWAMLTGCINTVHNNNKTKTNSHSSTGIGIAESVGGTWVRSTGRAPVRGDKADVDSRRG